MQERNLAAGDDEVLRHYIRTRGGDETGAGAADGLTLIEAVERGALRMDVFVTTARIAELHRVERASADGGPAAMIDATFNLKGVNKGRRGRGA